MGRTQQVIADTVSKELDLSQRVGRRFLQRVLDLVIDDIVYTGRIELRGLGVFVTVIRPGYTTIHPITGKPIHIPKKKIIRFRTSLSLRRRLNPTKPKPARKKKTLKS